MRQQTLLKNGHFVTGWHFDSRADFLKNRSLLPLSLREEYELQYPPSPPPSPPPPPPPPPTPGSDPVIILRNPKTARLYHICPPTRPQMLRKSWAVMLRPRKICLPEGWKGLSMGWLEELCLKRVGGGGGGAEGLRDGGGLWFCGDKQKVGEQITIGELIEFARVRLDEPAEGVWECPLFLELGSSEDQEEGEEEEEEEEEIAPLTGEWNEERRKKRRKEVEEEGVQVEVEDFVSGTTSETIAGYLGLSREEEGAEGEGGYGG
ncbi:hypothetical protein L873DRAFT_1839343 [Choiromyces venosus 120613-1]|uniref:Uncharacterized protein n=1 Tax=Choiromyces venosus 120613-1 TaxID=1336337 RepID=A0A3N4IWA2_9PEZI|nr:hypothetical protein L873DRAFT_1839343 [Choiromyces venosus 120613-1]